MSDVITGEEERYIKKEKKVGIWPFNKIKVEYVKAEKEEKMRKKKVEPAFDTEDRYEEDDDEDEDQDETPEEDDDDEEEDEVVAPAPTIKKKKDIVNKTQRMVSVPEELLSGIVTILNDDIEREEWVKGYNKQRIYEESHRLLMKDKKQE